MPVPLSSGGPAGGGASHFVDRIFNSNLKTKFNTNPCPQRSKKIPPEIIVMAPYIYIYTYERVKLEVKILSTKW